jgi:hypothetical protein
MLFDDLDKRTIGVVLGAMNGNPLALLKLSRGFYGTVFLEGKIKDGVLPQRSVIQSLLGIPIKSRLAARKPVFKVIGVPEIERRAKSQANAVTRLRSLSVKQLHSFVSPRIWLCHNCKMFFLAKDTRFRVYCTSRCGSKYEAIKAMKKQRAANRTKKLRRARAAQRLCPPGWDWKRFVVSRTGLPQNFLTYAVKSGDLKDVDHTSVCQTDVHAAARLYDV